jgi:hypothetical protein
LIQRVVRRRFSSTCNLTCTYGKYAKVNGVAVKFSTPRSNRTVTFVTAIGRGCSEQIKAQSFTDGLSRFEELSRREAGDTAILYALDLIEHNGEDLRKRPFLDRNAALRRLLGGMKAGIRLNEHVAEDGPTVFAHACQLGAEGIVSKKVDSTYRSGPCRVWIKVRNPATSPCSGSGARFGIDEPEAARANGEASRGPSAALAGSRCGRGLNTPRHLTQSIHRFKK